MKTKPAHAIKLTLAAAAVAVLLGVGAILGFGQISQARANEAEAAATHAGVDKVTLVGARGNPVEWGSLKGRPRAVFFGFTHCPVICPVTIYELIKAVETLGPAAAEVEIEFVSIDPERDTPARLKEYFSGFGPRVNAFTGTPEAIAKVAASYQVTYKRMADPHGEYAMSHTTTIFLLDRSGRVMDVLAYDTPAQVIKTRLLALADS